MRLPQTGIDTTREIVRQENPKLFLTQEKINIVIAKTAEQLMKLVDCRPYSGSLHTSSLKATTQFFNGTPGEGKTAHMSAFYRCRHFLIVIFSNMGYTPLMAAHLCLFDVQAQSVCTGRRENFYLFSGDRSLVSGARHSSKKHASH